jgi:cysteine desulfurase
MGIYLDYAAATPVDPDVLAAMKPFFGANFHNPSALYGPAVKASRALEAARSDIATVLGAKSPEIIFTAGGTEANNLAIHGVMQQYPEARVAISAIEHDSVMAPSRQWNPISLKVNETGILEPETVAESLTEDTVLVSVMYANNEIGTVQPIRRIAAELAKIRSERQKQGNKLPLYFHVDAAQAGNYLDMHVHRLGVDLMTINGGKLYGPKQTGVLYVCSGVNLKPILQGGGQERGLRSGTENVAGAVGLAKALQKSVSLRHAETERLKELQKIFIDLLKKELPQSVVNGSLKHRLPNNIHVTFPGTDNERVLMALDMEGIYAAAGSACSASHEEPSHVLKAIGLPEKDIRASVRFSLGRQTGGEDIEQAVNMLRAQARA